ncbi:hypothetical protein CHU92_03585 [Flavobacterium cyanobacteriorum]|uniref:GLPGLI family protein n=1 Tax=Flavobacterium cyanobacteriorum TaxID=2022802 RepID=A0A255ZPB6_9FLAO|nr:GLPGLI family protein [Flavobacterium cyanobacteriorum]OYQ43249.1 hypothetical protein CHU92_03585 [Flavobacterium cyanobacteriorum]
MKKNFILLVLASVTMLCFAQPKKTDLKVEYKLFCDTDVPVKATHLLFVKNDVAINQDKLSTTERWTEKPSKYDMNIAKIQGDYEPYMKIDRKKKEMLFFGALGQNIVLVKDIYTDLKWIITKESKTIAGYNCTKATTSYRGREWIAWFTIEIPVPFGPWKLHGLPGLILEAYDSTNRYTYKAVKIEMVTDDIFSKDFSTLMATSRKKVIPIRQFIDENLEYNENRFKALMANTEFEIQVKNEPRSGEELIYEWEE